ncbi:MAG: ThuA domain-containing protein [Clostridia bacterium]|nr:ThuA domain-containing protein [Clostridia bacterium]
MKKALIVCGNDFHDPENISALFAEMLKELDCESTITWDPKALHGNLREYDLFIPLFTHADYADSTVSNISNAVANGLCMVGCHGGMSDACPSNLEWQLMVGSHWVAHPGCEIDYRVNVDKSSELIGDIEDFDVWTEQYYNLIDPAVKVHATTDVVELGRPHNANGVIKLPVVYTKMWGKGKIYYNALGHDVAVFEKYPGAKEMMRKGFMWALEEV